MLLKCSTCKEDKDPSCFHKAGNKKRGYQFSCIACRKKIKNKQRESMTEQEWYLTQRQYWLKSQYGLNLSDYNDLIKEQNHKCAICETDEVDAFKGLLFVDHCHTSGKVRGLLCHHCNTALGKFKDSESILMRAIEYVRKNNGS
jgi:hypothetical protein